MFNPQKTTFIILVVLICTCTTKFCTHCDAAGTTFVCALGHTGNNTHSLTHVGLVVVRIHTYCNYQQLLHVPSSIVTEF